MPIKAIIMAGGEGTRLRPLTLNRPKPLVPIVGKPCMWYALELLKRHGIKEVAATLWYMPDAIREAFGDQLTYYEETLPIGTAGSIRLAKADVAQTLVVLSGDGLTDCDLTAALQFHREKKAMATLVLKSMPVPLAYGVVLTQEDGRIVRFLEKPDWSQVFSDQVNTGIYILDKSVLDLIPEDKPYDFGQDLFPKMVRDGLPVYGYTMQGYWCDVGDQGAYVKAQLDLMQGLVDLPIAATRLGNVFMGRNAFVNEDAAIEGLCFVGDGARVARGAILYEGTVIGGKSVVGEGTRLERTCLWENVQVGRCAHLRGAVLCDESVAHSGVTMEEDTALGAKAEVMKGAVLAPGVKIWPNRMVHRDARVYENVVWGDLRQMSIAGSGCEIESGADADALCAALIEALEINSASIMHDGSAEALKHRLIGALASRGVRITQMDGGTQASLLRIQRYLRVDLGLFVKGDRVSISGANGQALSKAQERKVETIALRRDYKKKASADGECTALTGANHLYAALLSCDYEISKGIKAAIFCANAFVRKVAKELFAMLNCEYVRVEDDSDLGLLKGETGYLVSETGDSTFVVTRDGILDEVRQAMLGYWCLLKRGCDVLFLPQDAPRGILKMVPEGMRVLSPSEKGEAPEAYDMQMALWHDGLQKMLLMMATLSDEGSLLSALGQLPQTHCVSREVPCPIKEKGRVLRMLGSAAKDKEMNEGIRVLLKNGSAHMTPAVDRATFMVTAESGDAEFAKELCDLYARDIEKILGVE